MTYRWLPVCKLNDKTWIHNLAEVDRKVGWLHETETADKPGYVISPKGIAYNVVKESNWNRQHDWLLVGNNETPDSAVERLNALQFKPAPSKGLPTGDQERKSLPIFTILTKYFPDALLEVAAVAKAGNDQHNPGQPLHWARGKSTDQMNTALRHMMDHGLGNEKDTDGRFHLGKAAWRVLAELQLAIEKDGGFTREEKR